MYVSIYIRKHVCIEAFIFCVHEHFANMYVCVCMHAWCVQRLGLKVLMVTCHHKGAEGRPWYSSREVSICNFEQALQPLLLYLVLVVQGQGHS